MSKLGGFKIRITWEDFFFISLHSLWIKDKSNDLGFDRPLLIFVHHY